MKLKSIMLALVFLLLFACSKKEWQPDLVGNIVGRVFLFDEFGTPLDNYGGVTITAFGSSRNYTAESDASGRFEISSAPTGTYELQFSKAGFGVLMRYGIQHLGGAPTILGDGTQAYFLYKYSSAHINSLSLVADTILADISWPAGHGNSVMLQVFYALQPSFNVSQAEYVENIPMVLQGDMFRGLAFQTSSPFAGGRKIYCRARVYTIVESVGFDTFSDGTSSYTLNGISTNNVGNDNLDIYPNAGELSSEFSYDLP